MHSCPLSYPPLVFFQTNHSPSTRSPRPSLLLDHTWGSGPKIPFPNDHQCSSRTCLASAQKPPLPPQRLGTKLGLERPPPEGWLGWVGGAWVGRWGGQGGRDAGSMHTRPLTEPPQPGWEEEGWFVALICTLVPLLHPLSPNIRGQPGFRDCLYDVHNLPLQFYR